MERCLTEILSSYKKGRGELIQILQEIQAEFGYLSHETMLETARFIGLPESRVYAVASFYSQFRFSPVGRKIVMVCRGTACHVRGGPQVLDEVKRQLGIEEGETTPDMEYTLETVACIGACGLAPCMMINKGVHGRLSPKKVKEIFAARKRGVQNVR